MTKQYSDSEFFECQVVEQKVSQIILHFNIDNTIFLQENEISEKKDQVNFKKLKLLNILVNYAWGIKQQDNSFKLTQNYFSKSPKETNSINFYTYVEQNYQFEGDQNSILKQKLDIYDNFLNKGAGIKLQPDFDKIISELKLPDFVNKELEILKKQDFSKSDLKPSEIEFQKSIIDLFQSGYYQILPIFFKTFLKLKELKKKISIVFRSRNLNYLNKIIHEFNVFCQNRHLLFNGHNGTQSCRFDGLKSSLKYTIESLNQLTLYDNPECQMGIQGCFGVLERVKDENLEKYFENDIEDEKIFIDEGQDLYSSLIDQVTNECFGMAILDDNKQMFQIDFTDYDNLQILFDSGDVNDLQVQDIITQEIVKNDNLYVVRVSPINVLKDSEYYLKMIKKIERLRNEYIYRQENGLNVYEEPQVQKSEWDILQEAPTKQYLRQTVLPLLNNALSIVEIERPIDPLSFIAMYLLKNKEKAQLPQKN